MCVGDLLSHVVTDTVFDSPVRYFCREFDCVVLVFLLWDDLASLRILLELMPVVWFAVTVCVDIDEDYILSVRVVHVVTVGWVDFRVIVPLSVLVTVDVVDMSVAVPVDTTFEIAVTVDVFPYDVFLYPCVRDAVTVCVLEYLDVVRIVWVIL